jgi:hypothetical protein
LGPRGRIRPDQIRVVSGSQIRRLGAVGSVKSKEQESVGDEYYYMLLYVMLIYFG